MGGRLAAALIVAIVLAAYSGPSPGQQSSPRNLPKPRATARNLQRAAALCDKGNRALNQGITGKAQEAFTQALELVPDFPDGHLGIGNIDMKEGRFEEALAEFERAKDAYRGMEDVIYELEMERYEQVQRKIETYHAALDYYNNELHSGMGRPVTIQSEIMTAEQALRALQAVQPPTRGTHHEEHAEVDFYIGNAQFRLGRIADALASWETCAAESPRFGSVYINLAVAYSKKGRIDDARQAIARAEALGFPVNPQMKVDLLRAAAQAGPAGGGTSTRPEGVHRSPDFSLQD